MKKINTVFFSLIFILFYTLFPLTTSAATEPELPRIYIDTSLPAVSGKAIEVNSGGDLQKALNEAVYGDEIVLQSGAEFIGSFILKKKTGSGVITIRSSDMSKLPPPITRVDPSKHASYMAKIKSSGKNVAALSTEDGASGYRIIGIEFGKVDPSAVVTNLILLGNGSETSVDQLPKNIVLDRIYAHGDPTSNLRRCIALNGATLSVIDSYISDCHEVGADSQAIAGWNGTGPFKIVNNYLEAAAENILFGGNDPKITGLVSEDIEIRRNHLFKPLSWKIGDPNYAGKAWAVKNIFELKNARRVLFDGNILENSWVHGQTGVAIVLKSVNQNGKCTWCVTEDVTLSNNIVRNAVEGVRISATEGNPKPIKASRIKIENTIFENMTGKIFQILGGVSDVTLENVTAHSPKSILFGDNGDQSVNPNLTIKNSVLERGQYGIGAGADEGKKYLDKWFPGNTFENNVLVNTSGEFSDTKLSQKYSVSTTVVATKAAVSSGAGADMNRINAAIASASSPVTVVNPGKVETPKENTQTPSVSSGSSRGGGGGSSGSSQSPTPSTEDAGAIQKLKSQIALLMAQLAALSGQTVNASSGLSLSFTQNLTIGSDGSEVVTLQQMLVAQGHLVMPAGVAYGYFGPLTREAVSRWQTKRGINPATGYWGPISRSLSQSF